MMLCLAAAVSAHPNLTGLPGSNVLQQLVNGAEAWALRSRCWARSSGRRCGRSPRTPTTTTTRRADGWRR